MMPRARSSTMRSLICLGFVLGLASVSSPANANKIYDDASEEVTDELAWRGIVLRSVRMPDDFGAHLLALDHKAQLIDRSRDVTTMADADVWIVGLNDWTDTDWLVQSPLHRHFARELTETDPEVFFKSFQWNAGRGRTLDLHFVNLSQAASMTKACLAQTLYRMSAVHFQERNSELWPVPPARAKPVVSPSISVAEKDHCAQSRAVN